MNKQELEEKLIKQKVNPYMYCLEGGLPSEQYCLEESYGKWFVYYSERGIKSGIKEFSTEEAACEYFYNDIMQDF